MKKSSFDTAVFWVCLVANSMCAILTAIMGNWNAVLGWTCATTWLLQCRYTEKKLARYRRYGR